MRGDDGDAVRVAEGEVGVQEEEDVGERHAEREGGGGPEEGVRVEDYDEEGGFVFWEGVSGREKKRPGNGPMVPW